jgi:DNA-binding NarL/FixJ family response regulator
VRDCRVIIADDHPLLIQGIAITVNEREGMSVVATLCDAESVARSVKSVHPTADVLLIDAGMATLVGLLPGPSANVTLRPRLLLMTTDIDADLLLTMLSNGASGCILKRITPKALCDAIDLVHEGGTVIGPGMTAALRSVLARGSATPYVNSLSGLTDRERQVLGLVARGHDNRYIGSALYLSEKTVRNHVSRLFTKLGATRRAQIVALARDAGLGSAHSATPPAPRTIRPTDAASYRTS